mgnify:CR=1 FL=1
MGIRCIDGVQLRRLERVAVVRMLVVRSVAALASLSVAASCLVLAGELHLLPSALQEAVLWSRTVLEAWRPK